MKSLVPVVAVAALVVGCGSSSSRDDGGGGGGGSKPAPISSAEKAKVGRVVVDAQGRTLYRFTAENQGRPVCTGACAKTWPPATVNDASALPDHVATVKRPDGGGLQLTYDGHPLYRYAGDRSPGDANGEGVGGQWYAIKVGGGAGAGAESGGSPTTQEEKRSYGY